jgi:hypothetical protein
MAKIKFDEMKVLNIAQPNAHNVIFNGKNIENRSTPTKIRGTIAIYGSKTCSRDRFENQKIGDVKIEDCSFGFIIGFVDVVDCIVEDQLKSETKKWFQGPYGYVLENPIALPRPIAVSPPKGAIIWWTIDGPKLQECLNQIPERKIIALTKVEHSKDSPKSKVKTAGRIRLTPSAALSKIVGTEATSYKKAAFKVIEYIENNDLYDHDADVIKADTTLTKIFGKKVIPYKEFKALLLEQLDFAA